MTPLAPAASAALVSDPVAIPPASHTGLPSAMASARGRNSSATLGDEPVGTPRNRASRLAVGAHHDEDENPCGTEFVDQLAVTAEGHHGHVDARADTHGNVAAAQERREQVDRDCAAWRVRTHSRNRLA